MPVPSRSPKSADAASGKYKVSDAEAKGYYLQLGKNLNERNTVALKYDQDTDAAGDEVDTFGVAWLHYLDTASRLRLALETPSEDPDLDNDSVTLEYQYKF